MSDINTEIAGYVSNYIFNYSENIAFLVDVKTGKTKFYRNDFIISTNKDGRTEFDYSEIIEIIKNKILWEQKENIETHIPLEKVKAELKKENRYYFEFFDFNEKGEIHKKRFTFFYGDKEKKKIVGMIRDIQNIYEKEQKLLDKITDEKNKLTTFQASFLSGISQEVRNPLNVMLGLATLIKNKIPGDKEIGEYIEQITAGGQHIVTMVSNILDSLNIQNGVFMFNNKPDRMSRVMTFVKNAFNPECATRNIEFKTSFEEKGPLILFDMKRMKQLLVTLISTSLYKAKPGAEISIKYSSKTENNTVHGFFEFCDTNEKIDGRLLNALCADDDTDLMNIRFFGKGINLVLFKKLLRKSGGELEVIREGEKNIFRFAIDFDMCEEKKVQNNDASVLMGKRIMVVDDHPMNIQIVDALLKPYGVNTESAENGMDALNLFKEKGINHFDAIIMDIKMPVLDGLEASKQIRILKRPDALTVPIIAMTANVQDSDREKSFASGMNAHLEKPLEPDDLIHTLISFLNV